jgi:hypothetical protein
MLLSSKVSALRNLPPWPIVHFAHTHLPAVFERANETLHKSREILIIYLRRSVEEID